MFVYQRRTLTLRPIFSNASQTVRLIAAAGVTRGVDFEVRYTMEPDFFNSEDEDLTVRLFANKMPGNSVTTTTYRDDLGSLNSPEWNATETFGYDIGDVGING